MSKPIITRAAVAAAAALGLAGSFYAGAAYAADPKLDAAHDNVAKAITLLQAAQNEGVKPPFGGHRAKAVRLLKRAQSEIGKAKHFADNPRPKRKKPPKKTK